MKLTMIAVFVLAMVAGRDAAAECPNWIDGVSVASAENECWCPTVSYRHNTAPLHNDPAVYVMRIEWLCNQGQMFPTREETIAYIESGAIKGLWEFDALVCGDVAKCRWVPAAAFDHIDLVQIVHPPHADRR